jgi:hypothetical protein
MSKLCITCNFLLSPKAIKDQCAVCRHKDASKKYIQKNKESFTEYQRVYRDNNRELCNQRARNSYRKKPEEYNAKNKILYREKNGISIDSPFKKNKNGEGNIDVNGYKTITKKGHPNQMDAKGRVREHVFVMSEFLGRPLRKGENVHHRNGIRHDNRIENLELWSTMQPPGQRVEDKIKWGIEFLSSYGYKVIKE